MWFFFKKCSVFTYDMSYDHDLITLKVFSGTIIKKHLHSKFHISNGNTG